MGGCSLQAGGRNLQASKAELKHQLPKLINCQPSKLFARGSTPITTSINISSLPSSPIPQQPLFLSIVEILISAPFCSGMSHKMNVPKIVQQQQDVQSPKMIAGVQNCVIVWSNNFDGCGQREIIRYNFTGQIIFSPLPSVFF